jgi:hypothetical protein
MSGKLILAALFQDDEMSSDGEKETAISHTSKQVCPDMTQPDIRVTVQKPRKKRAPAAKSSDTSPASKKPKVEPMFSAVEGADGKVLCVFVNGECIPLWPQYKDKAAACNFIRVGTSEDWVNKFMVASRAARKDEMAQAQEKIESCKDKKKWTKHFVKCVCDEVLLEFKASMGVARAKLEKTAKGEMRISEGAKGEQDNLLGVKMRGCNVIASTNARQLYIQATEKSVEWIQSGLGNSVKAFLDKELRAISHTSSGAADDHAAVMHNMRAGVRDKIRWMPEPCRWSLKCSGELGRVEAYCKEHHINLKVAPDLCGEAFLNARDDVFMDAVKVWNAVDASGRKRIVMPERRLNVQMVTVPYTEAMSHTDSEREAEQSEGDA